MSRTNAKALFTEYNIKGRTVTTALTESKENQDLREKTLWVNRETKESKASQAKPVLSENLDPMVLMLPDPPESKVLRDRLEPTVMTELPEKKDLLELRERQVSGRHYCDFVNSLWKETLPNMGTGQCFAD